MRDVVVPDWFWCLLRLPRRSRHRCALGIGHQDAVTPGSGVTPMTEPCGVRRTSRSQQCSKISNRLGKPKICVRWQKCRLRQPGGQGEIRAIAHPGSSSRSPGSAFCAWYTPMRLPNGA